MLMAGLDGIKNQIDPGDGTDVDLFELPAEQLAKISTVPSSSWGLQALDADKDYLPAGGSSPKTSSRTGLISSTRKFSSCVSAPIPTSSRCTTTPDQRRETFKGGPRAPFLCPATFLV